jgi:hypothetical protein
MKPPLQLTGRRVYGPDVLSTLNRAFDEAWAEISGNFADDPLIVQSARNRLADALLRAADQQGCRDLERVKPPPFGAWRSATGGLEGSEPRRPDRRPTMLGAADTFLRLPQGIAKTNVFRKRCLRGSTPSIASALPGALVTTDRARRRRTARADTIPRATQTPWPARTPPTTYF